MIDYHALRALKAVIEFQNFEQASKSLNITQPAVTQRIQNFESYLGQKLLIRKLPYQATERGEELLSLLKKVTILEEEISKGEDFKPTIKIALNRDSLDLYFLDVLNDRKLSQKVNLQILAEDQNKTLNFLKSGQVDMCISSHKTPLPNHNVIKLGDMKYTLVCSKNFYKKYFTSGVNKKNLSKAPLVIFDKDDKVQHIYLKEHYNLESFAQINLMPSVLSFKQAIIGGYGYGLLPVIDVKREIKANRIIQLNPSKDFNIPLYLHQWEYQRSYTKLLTEKIIKAAKALAP